MERKIAFKALVGSHNYNLATPESDEDFKVFVYPTFDDLYLGRMYSNQTITQTEDNNVHDIRKLGELLWKSNINFMEALFSSQLHIDSKQYRDITPIIEMRNELATINLPYLCNACIGMYHEKVKRLEQGTEGTMHLVEKYHYDTKQAQHAYRVLDFLYRFSLNNFTSFTDAMIYRDNENHLGYVTKTLMMQIKAGYFHLDLMKSILNDKLYFTKETVEPLYMKQQPNEALKEKLNQMIKDVVKKNLEL